MSRVSPSPSPITDKVVRSIVDLIRNQSLLNEDYCMYLKYERQPSASLCGLSHHRTQKCESLAI